MGHIFIDAMVAQHLFSRGAVCMILTQSVLAQLQSLQLQYQYSVAAIVQVLVVSALPL